MLVMYAGIHGAASVAGGPPPEGPDLVLVVSGDYLIMLGDHCFPSWTTSLRGLIVRAYVSPSPTEPGHGAFRLFNWATPATGGTPGSRHRRRSDLRSPRRHPGLPIGPGLDVAWVKGALILLPPSRMDL